MHPPHDPDGRRRGRLLRELRIIATDKTIEEIAAEAEVHYKTLQRWETRGKADWPQFHKYLKALEKEAKARNKKLPNTLPEFVAKEEEVLRQFFGLPLKPPGDSRTREEFLQDEADYAQQEPYRYRGIKEVEDFVGSLVAGSPVPKPVLPSDQIAAADSWETLPNKAFDIRLVFPIEEHTISIHRRSSAAWRCPFLLSIDLRDQRYGIYNGNGKKLLLERFVDNPTGKVPPSREALYRASEEIDHFMGESTEKNGDLSWKDLAKGHFVPLRHASAGVLPIAHRLGRGSGGDDGDWVALFVRDIPPKGLNVANGASEGATEYRNLEELISREPAEEIVLLKHRPTPGGRVQQFAFFDRGGGRALADGETFRQFLDAHVRLRQQHDNIKIEVGNERRFLEPVRTPFAVRIMDTDGHSRCVDVIFSVNPPELGIEVIRPYRFDLHEGEWLIDGEVLPSSRAQFPLLIRRPIVLIRLEFLREQFRAKRGLGEIIASRHFLGGKKLGEIPADAVHVFAEIDLRKRRLEYIESQLSSAPGEAETAALLCEQRLIQHWLSNYERILSDAQDGKALRGDLVTTFCPVTYRTIEAGFRHHVAGF